VSNAVPMIFRGRCDLAARVAWGLHDEAVQRLFRRRTFSSRAGRTNTAAQTRAPRPIQRIESRGAGSRYGQVASVLRTVPRRLGLWLRTRWRALFVIVVGVGWRRTGQGAKRGLQIETRTATRLHGLRVRRRAVGRVPCGPSRGAGWPHGAAGVPFPAASVPSPAAVGGPRNAC
jgi:hypothetical protein